MTRIHRFRQRMFLLLATTLLVLSLALAGCGASIAAQGNTNTTSLYSTNQAPQPGATGGPSQLQNDDRQVQSIMRSLNSALNDVNTSDAAASQDNGQIP